MSIPPLLSDAFIDDLVRLLFRTLPPPPLADLHCILDHVLRLAGREVRAAVRRERARSRAALRAQLAHPH